jgi:hypothetical protein
LFSSYKIGFFFDDKGFAQSTTMNGIWLGKIYDDDHHHNNFKALLFSLPNTFTLTLFVIFSLPKIWEIFGENMFF